MYKLLLLLLLISLNVPGQTIPLTQRERTGPCEICFTPYAKWYNHKTYKYYCRDCVFKKDSVNQLIINSHGQ